MKGDDDLSNTPFWRSVLVVQKNSETAVFAIDLEKKIKWR